MSMSDETLKQAASITIAAMGNGSASWIGNPDKVTAFFEAIARKIDQLRDEPDSPQRR
jgi:hypothetical protein